MRLRLLIPELLVLALVAAPAADAHGLTGTPPSSAWGYVWLGVRHMVGGWDHLLFITGIVILAGEAWRAATLLSVFVLGHSTTLLAATLTGLEVSPDLVDVMIALSVAFVGWRIYHGRRPQDWGLTVAAIAVFGLVHGLGLATRLQGLPLPEGWPLVGRVLAFILGVAIGQLFALSAILALGLLALRFQPALKAYRPQAALAFVGVGILAAAAVSFLALRPDTAISAPRSTAESTCTVEPYSPDLSEAMRGGHPDRAFYEAGEGSNPADLQRAMGDRSIIVVYNRSLASQDRAELRRWVQESGGMIAVPGATDMTETMEMLTLSKRYTCQGFDIDALDSFRNAWFSG